MLLSVTKLRKNESSTKKKRSFLFVLPSESNFGVAKVRKNESSTKKKRSFLFVLPSESNFGFCGFNPPFKTYHFGLYSKK